MLCRLTDSPLVFKFGQNLDEAVALAAASFCCGLQNLFVD